MYETRALSGAASPAVWREEIAARWVALAAIVILLTREPVVLLAPQLWAEDGPVFIGQVLRTGWGGLFEPYAGYFHVLSRTVANILVPLVPLESLPLTFNLTAVALSGLAVYLVASARVPVAHRWLYALAVVLVPHDGEVFGTITNLQWFVSIVFFTLVIQSPATAWRESLRDSLIALVCGFSGPFALLILPLLLVRFALVIRPTRFDLLAFAVITVAAGATLATFLTAPSRGDISGYLAFPEYAILAVVGFLFSPSLGQLVSLPIGTLANYVLGLIIGLGIFVAVVRPASAWFREQGKVGWAAAAMAAYALALTLLTVQRVPFWLLHVVGPRAESSARYFFGSHVLLVWLLIYLASFSHGRLRKAAAIVLALVAVSVAIQFQSVPIQYVDWPSQVATVGHDWKRVQVMPTWGMQICRYPCSSAEAPAP